MSIYYETEKQYKAKNGFFTWTINWNTAEITSGAESNNGYIVQKIVRRTETSEPIEAIEKEFENYNHEYFEAWQVNANRVCLPHDYHYHDRWIYSSKWGTMECTLADISNKFGTSGSVTMDGYVFWVVEGSVAYNMVRDSFRYGAVTHAGGLLSSYTFDVAEKLKPICHRKLTGEWDFCTNERLIEGIIDCSNKGFHTHNEWIQTVYSFFGSMPIWSMIEESIKKTALMAEEAVPKIDREAIIAECKRELEERINAQRNR